ncbi:hypothetical protein NQ314_007141 [Rhamnusium bicolor]|uniref:HMG box domain-containing protein n=1 Tax=Rhamnusium bicolor TaxID=1586634 RepID=A0AAV8YTR0_9CUCU|nr:hypothetical protein NQ314_007141 [Rhamnusium bicolor]
MDNRPSRSHVKNRTSKITVQKIPSGSGKVSRNPFINFLKDYRKSNKHALNVVELTKRGAQLWRGMNDKEKSPYISLSKQAPVKYKQSRSRRRRRKRSRRRRKGRRRRRRSRSSSFTTEDSVERSDHERKTKDEKRKERNPDERNKGEKPPHASKDHNSNNKKGSDEYEVKYKNSKYEESRDFI